MESGKYNNNKMNKNKDLNMKLVPKISCLIPPFALILCHIGGSGKTGILNIFLQLGILIMPVIMVLGGFIEQDITTDELSEFSVIWMSLMYIPFLIHSSVQVGRENKRRSKIIFDLSPEGQQRIKDEAERNRQHNKDEAERDRQKRLKFDLTDISAISDKGARTIMDQYPTLESIQDASVEQLCKIPGVGESIATATKARLG